MAEYRPARECEICVTLIVFCTHIDCNSPARPPATELYSFAGHQYRTGDYFDRTFAPLPEYLFPLEKLPATQKHTIVDICPLLVRLRVMG